MISKKSFQRKILRQKKCALVVNSKSRKGEILYEKILAELNSKGFEITEKYYLKDPSNLKKIIKNLIEKKQKLIFVAGGDGTISSVIDFFYKKKSALAVIPIGTANNFAREIGIPINISKAIDIVLKGKIIDIDVGAINDDHFGNIATIGFSAEIVKNTKRNLKKLLGPVAYLVTGIKLFFKHKKFVAIITANNETFKIKTHQVIIANGGIIGTKKIAPHIHVDNHKILILVFKGNLIQFLKSFIFLKKDYAKQITISNKAYIDTYPKKEIYIDGEKHEMTPAKIKVLSNSVRVFAKKSYKDY